MGALRAGLLGTVGQSIAQVVDGSLRFDASKSHNFTRTPSAGNNKTYTFSFWAKHANPAANTDPNIFSTYVDTNNRSGIFLDTSGNYQLGWYTRSGGVSNGVMISSAVQRDWNAWYHYVIAIDSTNGIAADRQKMYINGERVTSFALETQLGLNDNTEINEAVAHYIGRYVAATQFYDGHLSQWHFIDGLSLGPGYFGFTDPLTGTWRPKKFRAEGTTVNDGTVWSDTCTFTRPTSGFDGLFNTANAAYLPSAGTGTITTAPFTIKNNLRIYNNARSDQGGQYTVTINGIPVSFDGTGTSSTAYRWTEIDLSGFSLPIRVTNLQYTVPGSSGTGFDAVEVDGVLMLDSTTTNLAYGTNGFWLPMDGNSPIGEDKSGQENDWTPVNFGGSNTIEKATGAKPILNTLGGTVARPGVFGSEVGAYYTVTTANGSVYQFDITSGDNPSLSFIRGATYKFDYSSFTGHPVLFSSTNPDSSTTAYTTGTSTASNVISFTVPHDAPDTLYYYCQNHPTSMNGAISITTDNTNADQYASNCVLALPLVGSKDDVSNQINNTNTTKTITNNGNAAASSAQSIFYNGSWYFPGVNVSDGFSVNSGTGISGSDDFCIETWYYMTGTNGNVSPVMRQWGSISGSDIGVGFWPSGGTYYYMFYPLTQAITSIEAAKLNEWTHMAWTRQSGTLRLFVNGVQKYSASSNTTNILNSGVDYHLGTAHPSYSINEVFKGYLQDFRIYKGTAKYTSNFIPASANPDILPDTPSGVSGGSKLTKITDGSVSFDGANDKLSLTSSSAVDTTDFTVECFVYPNELSSSPNQTFVEFQTGTRWIFGMKGSTNYMYFWRGSEYISSTPVSPKRWNHVAWVKSGTTLKQYLNGIEVHSQTGLVGAFTSDIISIGENNDGAEDFEGFISNVRVVESALYTSNFTPPTSPLTNVTNTTLLCCQSNTSATTAAVTPGSITASGEAAASNFNPFTTDINAVRGQESGYATLNPLDKNGGTLSDGNLFITSASTSNVNATLDVSSGKWYWECTITGSASGGVIGVGAGSVMAGTALANLSKIYGWSPNGSKYQNTTQLSYAGTYGVGDIIGVSFDADTRQLTFYKNGVSQGVAFTVDSGYEYKPQMHLNGMNVACNFGQKPFKFPPPEGFQPLNASTVRPSTVIARPDQYVGVATYTGDSVDGRVISLPFRPDLVMVKVRNQGTQDWVLGDSVRGDEAVFNVNQNYTETSPSNYGGVGFSVSKGFTLEKGQDAVNGHKQTNENTWTYASWAWKAGRPTTPTSGAVRINGPTDGAATATGYLTIPSSNSSDFNFGTGDFTWEAFVYCDDWTGGSANDDQFVIGHAPSPASGDISGLFVDGGQSYYYSNKASSRFVITGPVLADKRWYHIAASRESGTLRMFVDGVSVGSASYTDTYADAIFTLGRNEDNDKNQFRGFISNFRVIKGTALYTSDFTPPTEQLTAVTNTKLLCCQSNTSAGAAAASPNISGVNDGTVWSDNTSASGGFNSSYPKTNIFNGTITSLNRGEAASVDVPINIDFSSITVSSTVSIWSGKSSVRYQINNSGSYTSYSDAVESWKDISFSGTLTNLKILHGSAGQAAGLSGLKVDGVILVDPVTANGDATATQLNPFDAFSVDGVGYATTTSAGLTAGTITPTGASVNTKSGFSIITYTATTGTATVPHGLGSAPSLVITKCRNIISDFLTQHISLADNHVLFLNNNSSASNASANGALPKPTSTVFSVNNIQGLNGISGTSMIAYCWADVPGLQKFGIYTGNSSADGPFIELGFRPALVIIKIATGANDSWRIYDSERNKFNLTNNRLLLDTNVIEGQSVGIDILSNGFKLRDGDAAGNGSGNTYIYAAWAEAPSFNLFGAQSNAR